jgi:hypothetical protein
MSLEMHDSFSWLLLVFMRPTDCRTRYDILMARFRLIFVMQLTKEELLLLPAHN